MSTHLTPLSLACITAANRGSKTENKEGVHIWAPFFCPLGGEARLGRLFDQIRMNYK